MAEAAIRLDRSKPFSEVRGDRTPNDPHYKVHFFQVYKAGKKNVLLPFDASGILVPDDGRTEPYEGIAEGKPVLHHPLYDKDMRDLVEKLRARAKAPAVAAEETDDDGDGEAIGPVGGDNDDGVNLEAWLRGEAQYQPFQLRAAVKQRYSKNITKIADMVVDLVLDEKLVPEAQVCAALAKYLPK